MKSLSTSFLVKGTELYLMIDYSRHPWFDQSRQQLSVEEGKAEERSATRDKLVFLRWSTSGIFISTYFSGKYKKKRPEGLFVFNSGLFDQ